jgi:hypothetical protein
MYIYFILFYFILLWHVSINWSSSGHLYKTQNKLQRRANNIFLNCIPLNLPNNIKNYVKLVSSLWYINDMYGTELSDAETKLKYRTLKTLLFKLVINYFYCYFELQTFAHDVKQGFKLYDIYPELRVVVDI